MKRLSFFVIPLLILNSCHKDPEIHESINPEIQFGNYSNVTTTFHDIIIEGGNPSSEYFSIDLDQNDTNDIRFSTSVYGSLGSGYYEISSVSTSHPNIELYGSRFDDTTYLSRDTTIYDIGTVEITYNQVYSCYKLTEHDSVFSVEENSFCLLQNRKDEFLDREGEYSDTTINFYRGYPFSNPIYIGGNGVDTNIYTETRIYSNCKVFNPNKICYIGFKLFSEGEETYGWVKICILGPNTILISESSILKQSY